MILPIEQERLTVRNVLTVVGFVQGSSGAKKLIGFL